MRILTGLVTAVLLVPSPSPAQRTPGNNGVSGGVAPDHAYLGEEKPDHTPRLFAPGIVSLGGFERDIAVSPDGGEVLYGMCASRCTLFITHRTQSGWSEPVEAPFAADSRFNVLEPTISPDGSRVLFLSDRPPGAAAAGPVRPWEHQNIWMSVRGPGGWSDPLVLGPAVNGDSASYHPSFAADGTLFFTREEAESRGTKVFRATSREGEFQPAAALAASFNDSWSPYNACVSPDGGVLVFCSRHSGPAGSAALWASFQGDGEPWSQPVMLDERINAPGAVAQSCSFSPDGRYFFFSSVRRDAFEGLPARLTLESFRVLHERPANGSSDVYWVNASEVRRLRPRALSTVDGLKD